MRKLSFAAWQEDEKGRNRFRIGEIHDAQGNLLARGRGRFVVSRLASGGSSRQLILVGQEILIFEESNMDSKKVNGSGNGSAIATNGA